ncbi:MAG: GNAT family N-acetyltransferase [Streptosporangiaceae bacterium]|nr:GNAT family N-acetyltransferase [Streptosporangiaceae bacterium]
MDASVVVGHVDSAQAVDPRFTGQAAVMLRQLVAGGAALGWLDPPEPAEVARLLREVAAAGRGDAYLAAAWVGADLAGLGYWRRYARPTYRPHADVQKVAIASGRQGHGIGRLLMTELITSAADAGVEILTLDFRGDNQRAARLYQSLGFTEYGRLPAFVAVGAARYDRVLYARDLRAPVSP